MKTVSELVGKIFLLVQPSNFKAYYELMEGDEVIGSFRMKRMFFFSTEAEGINGEHIEFYKSQWWKSEISIR